MKSYLLFLSAIALMIAAQQVVGAVITTDIEDVHLLAGDTWICDFNNDGTNDFQIRSITPGGQVWVDSFTVGCIGEAAFSFGSYSISDVGSTLDLLSLEQEQEALIMSGWPPFADFKTLGAIFSDGWTNSANGRKSIAFFYGDLHWGAEYGYGWIDATFDPSTYDIVIHGYAYESELRTPVKTTAIPESNALILVTIVLVGGLWRKPRQFPMTVSQTNSSRDLREGGGKLKPLP